MSINQHITSSVQVYQQCSYLFPHCSFLWMSSIPARQVPTILQVPILATQRKDVTNPSCISSVLFRVLVIILHSSHPTQGRYQPFVYLLCAIQGACHYSFSGCSFIPPNTRTIPCTPLSGISIVLLRVLHSHTPP